MGACMGGGGAFEIWECDRLPGLGLGPFWPSMVFSFQVGRLPAPCPVVLPVLVYLHHWTRLHRPEAAWVQARNPTTFLHCPVPLCCWRHHVHADWITQ